MYQSIAHYMTRSPRTITADESVFRARQLLEASDIRHLPVLDGGRLVGVLTERDIRLVEAAGHGGISTKVRDAMSRDPFVVSPNAPLHLVARTMADHRFGSAVVMDEGRVVGMFTVIDALTALAELLDTHFSAPTSDRWGRVSHVHHSESRP